MKKKYNKFINKITGICLIASLMFQPVSGAVAVAADNTVKAEISNTLQDITVPTAKTYILTESMNSIWIPVNAGRKGIIEFDCKVTGNSENVFVGLYKKQDSGAEKEYRLVSTEAKWNAPVSSEGNVYIYVEKAVNDRGKRVYVDITTVFYDQVTPEKIEKGKAYTIIQPAGNTDYRFVLKKAQKVSFDISTSEAYILDSSKAVSQNSIAQDYILDAGTYYLRIVKPGVHLLSYSGKNASVNKASNVTKKKAESIETNEQLYRKYKKTSSGELWYKIKADKKQKISVTCSYDGKVMGDFVDKITVYNSKGKKTETQKDGNTITLNKGKNYIKVKLIKEAKTGILNVKTAAVTENNISDYDIISLENSISVYANKLVKGTYVIDSYSKYEKFKKSIKKLYKSEYAGFNDDGDEFYTTLKRYDKEYFKTHILCIYAYDITESGQMTGSPEISIADDGNGKKVQLSVTRYSYASGINKPAVSYYFVNVKKSDVKNVKEYVKTEQPAAVAEMTESEKQLAKWKYNEYKPDASQTDYNVNVSGKMLDGAQLQAKWLPKNDVVIISTYKQYKKYVLNNTEKVAENLKDYDKNYFKKNNLVLYTYSSSDAGCKAQGAYITRETIDGVNTLVCSFAGHSYAAADDVTEYCYAVQISKKDMKKSERLESRYVVMK